MKCFLREGGEPLEEAKRYASLGDAKAAYMEGATELARYGQYHDASIHIAANCSELVEYPDYVLSLGPKGGLKCEKT